MDMNELKRIMMRGCFIVLASLLIGCGETSEEMIVSLNGAVTAFKTNEMKDFEKTINDLKSKAEKIREKAEQEGNTEDSYKADYIEMLCFALEDIAEAQNGLTGLQGAEHTGAFKLIQKVHEASKDQANASNISETESKLATQYGEQVLNDYLMVTSNLASSSEFIEIAKESTIEDNEFIVARDNIGELWKAIYKEMPYYDNLIQQTFGFTDEQMKDLKQIKAEPGIDSEEYKEGRSDLADSIARGIEDMKSSLERFAQEFSSSTSEFATNFDKNMKLRLVEITVGALVSGRNMVEQPGWNIEAYTGDSPKLRADSRKYADEMKQNNEIISRINEELKAITGDENAVSNYEETVEKIMEKIGELAEVLPEKEYNDLVDQINRIDLNKYVSTEGLGQEGVDYEYVTSSDIVEPVYYDRD